MLGVPVQGAADPAGVHSPALLGQHGIHHAKIIWKRRVLLIKHLKLIRHIYSQKREDRLLLLGHSHSLSLVASSLGVLSSGSEAPVVTKTTMSSDLLKTLQVLTNLVVQDVSHHLVGLAILHITLSIQEPIWDLVLARILNDGDISIFLKLEQFKPA